MPTRVVNVRHAKHWDVLIDRTSQWGCPYHIGADGDRKTVLLKYRYWLSGQSELLAQIPRLAGLVLGCWCSPLPCHGHILAAMADGSFDRKEFPLLFETWDSYYARQLASRNLQHKQH